jgi:hypothetical protein
MASLHLCIVLEAEAGQFQQLWRHAQVMLSAAQILMPEVGNELRQQALYVRTVPIPCDDPVNGGGVTKIVQPWRIAGPFIAPEACSTAYPLK